MNLTLKQKYCNFSVATLSAILCLYMLSSCGLGTEVGNGVKDEEKNKKQGTAASNSEGSDSGGGQESTNEDKEPLQDSSKSDVQAIDYGIDTRLLFNSCGSPFETVYKAPFELKGIVKNGSEELLKGAYDAELDSVTISNRKDNVLAKIKDDDVKGDHKVIVTAEDGSEIESKFACSAIDETDDNGIYTYKVTMTMLDTNGSPDQSKPESTLTWMVDKTKMIYDLISISISSDEAELLKMEAALD
jgi:hypothetical protein